MTSIHIWKNYVVKYKVSLGWLIILTDCKQSKTSRTAHTHFCSLLVLGENTIVRWLRYESHFFFFSCFYHSGMRAQPKAKLFNNAKSQSLIQNASGYNECIRFREFCMLVVLFGLVWFSVCIWQIIYNDISGQEKITLISEESWKEHFIHLIGLQWCYGFWVAFFMRAR